MTCRSEAVAGGSKVCPAGGEEHPSWATYCHEHRVYLDEEPEDSARARAQDALEGQVREEDVREGVKRFLRAQGFAVYDLEQGHRPHACSQCGGKIPGGSRQTQGLADLLFAGHGYAAFVELKSPTGRIREEQLAFRIHVQDEGGLDVHLWRSSAEAATWWERWRTGDYSAGNTHGHEGELA